MLDVEAVRASFPILGRRINDLPLVYLDSAASSLTPEEVLAAEAQYYRSFRANVHRGRHALSEEASEAFETARAEIAHFVGAGANAEVVFTSGTTAALNLVANGLPGLHEGEVVSTISEHHSTLLPWRRRSTLRLVKSDPLHPVDPEALLGLVGERTKVIVLAHASNVTGVLQPIEAVCRLGRERGIVTVVDVAQSVAHLPIDFEAIGCDFLAFSGHKALGPTGVGVLVGRREALEGLAPRDIGGGCVDEVTERDFEWRGLPARLEAGTPNVAGVLGLAAALRYLGALGATEVQDHARLLARAMKRGLRDIAGVRLLAAATDDLPIASIAVDAMTTTVNDLSIALSDRYGVMARAGLHCAQPCFAALGLGGGALRFSAHVYNTVDEVSYACRALAELLSVLRTR